MALMNELFLQWKTTTEVKIVVVDVWNIHNIFRSALGYMQGLRIRVQIHCRTNHFGRFGYDSVGFGCDLADSGVIRPIRVAPNPNRIS